MSLFRFLKTGLKLSSSRRFHPTPRFISQSFDDLAEVSAVDIESMIDVEDLWIDARGQRFPAPDLQLQSRNLWYEAGIHNPKLTSITRTSVSHLSKVNKHEIPYAIIKGPPLTPGESNYINPQKDIWIVKKEEPLEQNTRTDDSIVDNQEFKNWLDLIDLVTTNTELPPELDDNFEVLATVCSLTEEEAKRIEKIASSLDHTRYLNYRDAAQDIRKAAKFQWSNGDGGMAQNVIMRAASSICSHHALHYYDDPTLDDLSCSVNCVGGMAPNNHASTKYAVRTADKKLLRLQDVESQIAALRDPRKWEQDVDTYNEKENDDCKYWQLRNAVPDNIIYVRRTTDIVGVLLGEVKSHSTRSKDVQAQIFIHALQGLLYNTSSAALAMGPKDAIFLEIWLDNGMILHRKKYYDLYLKQHQVPEVMSSAGYQELFHDLVHYLWNTYFSK